MFEELKDMVWSTLYQHKQTTDKDLRNGTACNWAGQSNGGGNKSATDIIKMTSLLHLFSGFVMSKSCNFRHILQPVCHVLNIQLNYACIRHKSIFKVKIAI